MNGQTGFTFYNRDLSWLKFNGRILMEAGRQQVPLLERIKFLSIFSSNLDEFYRVRMPVLLALEKLNIEPGNEVSQENDLLQTANALIEAQQVSFGETLTGSIIPQLDNQGIRLVYASGLPEVIQETAKNYFLSHIMAFLQPVYLDEKTGFFPANNELYFLISTGPAHEEQLVVLNIPSLQLPRFFEFKQEGEIFVVFLDDLIRAHLAFIFPGKTIGSCYSFKVTRDAEIDLKDEYPGSISEQIEEQLSKRDFGLATRFLHEGRMSDAQIEKVKKIFGLKGASLVKGGRYHNLKDLIGFPVKNISLSNPPWPALHDKKLLDKSLFEIISAKDLIIHTPYQSYDTVLRFFNEAAADSRVTEIYITLYRVASNSKIVNALISAARNGKKVRVVVELKARFDEANNIKWAKKMKAAGVEIIYSIAALKVHAKVALVKRKTGDRLHYTGLLATGNFNESTAAFYTDHVLMTANKEMLREIELLFIFLAKRVKPASPDLIRFEHLLVAQFNLQQRFIELINREIDYAQQGQPASITIKMNNLEEKVLISKLYEAAQAGVQVRLIVRSICCLIPGIKDMSEHIQVTRIVDRYLEHGRVFIFNNGGAPEVFLGSADWMNRNIYRRIEVCFPVYDPQIKTALTEIIELQLADNVQSVHLNENLDNVPVQPGTNAVESQQAIYEYLKHQDAYVNT